MFLGDPYDMNLIAQRGVSRVAGAMDDLLSVVYKANGCWTESAFPCSVDPGTYFLKHLENPKGCAMLAPGQYRSAYQLGWHKGRRALVQVGPVTVRRDGDLDNILEPGVADTGLFGINIHDDVGKGAEASAGCIVLPVVHENLLLDILGRQVAAYGSKFTLTVLER